MARSDFNTSKNNQIEYYSDVYNSFGLNPITGQLARVTNIASIKQSIKNLLLTNLEERYYDKITVGANIDKPLFMLFDSPQASIILRATIEQCIQNHEPRAKLISVDINPIPDQNQYSVTIQFGVNNVTEPVSLNIILNRVR